MELGPCTSHLEEKKVDLYWAREVSPCTMNTHAWFTSPSRNNSLYRASSMKAISTAQGLIFSWLHGASSSEAIGAEVVVIFSSVELAPRTIHMHGSCQFQEKYHTSKYIAWFRAVYLQVYILDDSVLVLFFFDALWTIHIVQPLGFSHCFCHLNSLWKHIQGSRHIKSKSYSSMDDLSSARNSVLWLLAVWKYIRDN